MDAKQADANKPTYVTFPEAFTAPGGLLSQNVQPMGQSWIAAMGTARFISQLRPDDMQATDNVYFQATQTFVASLDGFTALEFSPSSDANGDPALFTMARYKALNFQERGLGMIVDVRVAIKGPTNLPDVPPMKADQVAVVVTGPAMADPAMKTVVPQPTQTVAVPSVDPVPPPGPQAAADAAAKSKKAK